MGSLATNDFILLCEGSSLGPNPKASAKVVMKTAEFIRDDDSAPFLRS